MRVLNPPAILLLTEDPDITRRVEAALAAVTKTLWIGCDAVPTNATVEVIVTDLSSVAEIRQRCPQYSRLESLEGGIGRPAILGIGAVEGADASLKSPPAEESLRLACTLLAHIARLRAEHELADRAGRRHRELAYTDPLTGVSNRRAWDEALDAITATTAPPQARWYLAIIDLDQFKEVNESGGLAAGDRVLVEVAQALAHAVRSNDLVARLGGDEFGVLLADLSGSDVGAVLERLRAAVAASNSAAAPRRVTASIGFARLSSAELHGAAVFAAAEQALRQAKRAGGNRVVEGSP